MLLHRYEINKLIGQQKLKGYTIMPLKVYIKDGLVKMEIGLARGKKLYDKREDIAKKDMKREMERDLKNRSRDSVRLWNFCEIKLIIGNMIQHVLY